MYLYLWLSTSVLNAVLEPTWILLCDEKHDLGSTGTLVWLLTVSSATVTVKSHTTKKGSLCIHMAVTAEIVLCIVSAFGSISCEPPGQLSPCRELLREDRNSPDLV